MIEISDLNKVVLDKLISSGFVPIEGNFIIDEDLLYAHRQIYSTYGNGKTNKFLKARRYAGLGLLSIKLSRKIPSKDIKEGFIYLIKNPAWPDRTKIGITQDLTRRLASYQTYDPFRSYYVESYEFVTNKQLTEKFTLNQFSKENDLGEWVSNSKAVDIIQNIREAIPLRTGELIFKDVNKIPIKLGDRVKFNTKNIYGNITSFKSSGLEITTNRGLIYKQVLPTSVFKLTK